MVKLRMGIILAKNKKDLKGWNKILKVFSFEKIDTLLEKLGILDYIRRTNKRYSPKLSLSPATVSPE